MTGPVSSDRGAVRRRSAALGAVIGLVAGVVLVLSMADTFNLSLPVLAAVALGLVGAALGPAVAERMPLAALAVAFATYAVGVLLFPVAWIAIAVVAGAGGLADPRLLGGVDDFLALYRLAPVGFVYALPTVPGVLAAAAVHAVAVRRLAPLPRQVDEHARRTFPAAHGGRRRVRARDGRDRLHHARADRRRDRLLTVSAADSAGSGAAP